MDYYLLKIWDFVKDPQHFPATFLAPFFILIISFLLKIPQRIFKMILNWIVEYKSNRLKTNFLHWIFNESEKRMGSENLQVFFSDLEKIYPKTLFRTIFLVTDMKIREKTFEKLSERLVRVSEKRYIFSKSDNADLSFVKEKQIIGEEKSYAKARLPKINLRVSRVVSKRRSL